MLHCKGGYFYTGHTDDLEARIAQHKAGTFEGFTKRFSPVEMVWSQEFVERDEALAAERQIKGWSRKKKLALIRGDWDAVSFHARSKSGPSTGSGRTDLGVSMKILNRLAAEAKDTHPKECCGLMLGAENQITQIQPTSNVHPKPETQFEIDPGDLIAAYQAEREGGPQVVGFYHSHPSGPPTPSATDRAMAARDGKIWAIIGQDEIKFWRDDPDGFKPLSYSVIDA